MKQAEDLTKHTMYFFKGDIARVQDLHPGLSAAIVVRTLLRRHIESLESPTSETPHLKVSI